MKITHLRARRQADAEVHDPLVKDLLEVLLCGLGAAAALMILYSVLPKSGNAASQAGAEPERAATRTETRVRRRPIPRGDSLTQVWVEADKGTGLEPSDIKLHGLEQQKIPRWMEGRNDIGWRCVFLVRRPAEELQNLDLVCRAGAAHEIMTGARLRLRIGIDSALYFADAIYVPASSVNGQARSAGVFLLSAGRDTPPLPAQPEPSTPNSRDEVRIVTIHPADAEAPLRGITPLRQ